VPILVKIDFFKCDRDSVHGWIHRYTDRCKLVL